jgi:hypothetical protein
MSLHRLSIFLSISLFANSAWACSCKQNNIDEVAYLKDIVLTKLKVNSPSFIERMRSYFEKPTYSKTYKVTVLENYKGTFTASDITTLIIDGEADCSSRLTYGEIIYIIVQKNNEGSTSNEVNICNMTSEKFAKAVKKEHTNPSDAYKSVDISEWIQLNKTTTRSIYADTKNVTKDPFGSYIWTLINDSSAKYKSQKIKVQISCNEKMFSISHEIGFSDFNASGDVLMTTVHAKMNTYRWLPLNESYSKLLKYTC